MKKLSKIVALLLAGAMAMVMLTACSGGGNGSNLKKVLVGAHHKNIPAVAGTYRSWRSPVDFFYFTTR